MCGEELVKAATPCITQIIKHGGGGTLLLCWVGGFANCKVRDLHQVRSKLNLTGYNSILQH